MSVGTVGLRTPDEGDRRDWHDWAAQVGRSKLLAVGRYGVFPELLWGLDRGAAIREISPTAGRVGLYGEGMPPNGFGFVAPRTTPSFDETSGGYSLN